MYTKDKTGLRLTAVFILSIYIAGLSPVGAYGQGTTAVSKSVIGAAEERSVRTLIWAEEGGIVVLAGACIRVPAGALAEDTEICIRRLARTEETGELLYNVTGGGGGYRFEPAGLRFLKKVEIDISYTSILEMKEAS